MGSYQLRFFTIDHIEILTHKVTLKGHMHKMIL